MVIWQTDKRLYSKDGTTKTESKFKVSVRVKDHSPMTGVATPFAVETNFWLEELICETCLESNIMWYVALESIIYILCETDAEIFKVLPSLFKEITNVEACLVINASSVFVATSVVVEDPFFYFSLSDYDSTSLDIPPVWNICSSYDQFSDNGFTWELTYLCSFFFSFFFLPYIFWNTNWA